MALPWLTELNDAQREAVTHGDGPLLVIAGAGTGKTKTLACRAAYLVQNGIDPERILLLTFTRRAAAEEEDALNTIRTAAANGATHLDMRTLPIGSRSREIAFGFGKHFCAGSRFALLEARTALNVLFDRLPNLRLDPAQREETGIVGMAFRGPNRLPVLFDAV